jgi:hypothetical protein
MPPRSSSALALALWLEVHDQLGKFVVFGVEVGDRQAEDRCKSLQDLQIGLMDASLVAVDSGAGYEIVQARFDAKIALRDAIGFPGLTQSAAVDRKLSFLSQAYVRSGVPCKEASGRTLEFDTTLNVAMVTKPQESAIVSAEKCFPQTGPVP